jgi:D-tagatose-1,6-bisphosphate aldolase subunit GatZ/KbaZ
MHVALHYGTVLLVEATSNQVDQFGGYTGMTPPQFRLRARWPQQGFPLARLVLGGDHLGPNAWQRAGRAAMQHAETLIAAYAAAGFHKIHLDCSMRCADDPQYLSDEVIAARSARLCIVAEQAAAGRPAAAGVRDRHRSADSGRRSLAGASRRRHRAAGRPRTLDVHRKAFMEQNLHRLAPRDRHGGAAGVDFDHSHIQHYDAAQAAALSAFVAGQPGIVFEAHSTDYQRETALHQMVRDHFAILKVGPAATFALREALMALCQIEAENWCRPARSRA